VLIDCGEDDRKRVVSAIPSCFFALSYGSRPTVGGNFATWRLNNVQQRATKLVISLKTVIISTQEGLLQLDLPTLTYGRLRGAIIEVYKLITNKINITPLHFLIYECMSVLLAYRPRLTAV